MAFDILYAPWRNQYVTDMVHTKASPEHQEECIFCEQFAQQRDREFYILRRFTHNLVMLNLYPYNAGHLLIIPLLHQAQPFKLDLKAQQELMALIGCSAKILQETLEAEGINVGMNLGKAAGAGIPAHLHVHILPRWAGDTNFLPTLGHTKQISTDLEKIYDQLKPPFAALNF